ncbi:hypothetical protein [Streptococcus anginosus]|uniref:hypothetical protein n=1 Tax=Streptococcus anginosus TaxID=1328 RepID=UPI0027314DFB|nr:hypothetical protein [Streptococcus anginosus]
MQRLIAQSTALRWQIELSKRVHFSSSEEPLLAKTSFSLSATSIGAQTIEQPYESRITN